MPHATVDVPLRRGTASRNTPNWSRWIAHSAAAILSAAVCFVGLTRGALVAGGSDSYGYVSEADLIAHGKLRVEQPIMERAAWTRYRATAFAPLGYQVTYDGRAIVPTYAPGYPLTMALFQVVGGRDAVFYVVPILGGIAVFATYLIGVQLIGVGTGLAAAALLATSPSFLYQLMSPMSDIPVTAWWALTFALLMLDRSGATFAAGVTTGIAILTRPNLVWLTCLPLGWLCVTSLRKHGLKPKAVEELVLFLAGPVLGCMVVAGINKRLYGSPFLSGYGPLRDLFAWSHFRPNVDRYREWLVTSETAIVALAVLAPIGWLYKGQPSPPRGRSSTSGTAVVLLLFVVAVVGSYLFYTVFDAWWALRFLLPAFPPLLVLSTTVLFFLTRRFTRILSPVVNVIIVGLIAYHGVTWSVERRTFRIREGEQKYVSAARYIAEHLPENAAIVSMLHSGSVRYYSGRLTVRFDLIGVEALDSALDDLRRLGYKPYLLLEVGSPGTELEFAL